MNSKNKKINIKELFAKHRNDLAVTKISIKLDWIIIFFLWIIVFVFLILFSIYIYKSTFSDASLSSLDKGIKSSENLNTEKLNRVISEFDKRQNKFNSL